MRHTKRMQRTVKADSRARLTLGLHFTPPGSQWRATRHPDGRITLDPLTDAPAPLPMQDALAEVAAHHEAMFSDSGNSPEEEITSRITTNAHPITSNYTILPDGTIQNNGPVEKYRPDHPGVEVIQHHTVPSLHRTDQHVWVAQPVTRETAIIACARCGILSSPFAAPEPMGCSGAPQSPVEEQRRDAVQRYLLSLTQR